MAVPFFPHRRIGDSLSAVTHSAEEAGEQSVSEAENCVRQHPESAVWSAFGAGLLLGAALAWVALAAHQRTWGDELEDLADGLRKKIGLD